jgi:hypothetical protein
MKIQLRLLTARWLALGLTLGVLSVASAGTFKRITIDGSFADWTGVPVAATDAEGDALRGFDLKEIYVANDDQNLYLRVVIYPSSTNANYNASHHQFFIDGDNDPSTGRGDLGLGAEMVVEDGYGFSQRYKNWYDGDVTGTGWAQAPQGVSPTFQYEARISRSVRDTQPADVPTGSGNPARDLPVFAQDTISIAAGVSDSSWSREDSIAAFVYEMAPKPLPFAGTQTVVGLTTATWRANDDGTDLGANWLAADYDDTQPGWKGGPGLFGFNAPAGVYPAPVNTSLTSGRSTYYLRTHFTWDADLNGVGLLVSNYLSAGAVIYLNGTELKRVRMPDGPVAYATRATGGPAQPGKAELIDLSASALVVGDNLLQIEVHPAAGAVSALVFGASLTASDNFPPRLEDPTQPADRAVIEGQTTTFSPGVLAGTGPFAYQWSKDGAPITDATNATLTLNPVMETDVGSYSVLITNPKGLKVASRAAVLTTTAVAVALTDPKLPADQVIAEATSATFTVAATGSLLTYQWYKGDEAIAGEVGPQLTLNNVPLSDSGTQFSVTVFNRVNSVTSRKATLTVVRDSIPPGIVSVSGGGRNVVVTFSEPVDAASAQKASNYSLDGNLQVQGAVLDPADDRKAALTTTPQTFGQPYKLSVNGVQDRFGNAAIATSLFRSAIVIDGNFDDWTSVPIALTQQQLNPGSIEYKDLYITNDNDYIYLRFTYYDPVGPLGPANYVNNYQIVFDTDSDPATGTWRGGEVMIENRNIYRLGGGWTDGSYQGADYAVAPGDIQSASFECRISRRATAVDNGLPAFPNASLAVFFCTRNSAWSEVAITAPPIPYTLATLAPLPATLNAKLIGTKVEITWPGGGVLETRANLSTGSWAPVPGAASGIQIDTTTAAAGFYRVRQ